MEQGKLRKTRHALPRVFAHVDDASRTVRITVSRHILEDSPRIGSELDEQAIAEHYGLASSGAPGTEGYGETVPGDPARTAEDDAWAADEEPAAKERAEIRRQIEPGASEPGPPSPGLLGSRGPG